jgi:aconitase A
VIFGSFLRLKERCFSEISFDVNPSSRQVLENLMEMGALGPLIAAGGRLHQSGCMGCIGMGQALPRTPSALEQCLEIFQDVPHIRR